MHTDRARRVGVCDGGDLVCDAAGVAGVAGAGAVAFGAGDVAGSGADHDGDAGAFNNPGIDSGYDGGGAASDNLPGDLGGAKPQPTASPAASNRNDRTPNHVIIESQAGAASSYKNNDSGSYAGRTRAGHIFACQAEGGGVLRQG